MELGLYKEFILFIVGVKFIVLFSVQKIIIVRLCLNVSNCPNSSGGRALDY